MPMPQSSLQSCSSPELVLSPLSFQTLHPTIAKPCGPVDYAPQIPLSIVLPGPAPPRLLKDDPRNSHFGLVIACIRLSVRSIRVFWMYNTVRSIRVY